MSQGKTNSWTDERTTKIRDFSELLNQLENASVKQKQLMLEIYTNAIEDRHNAHIMFGKLSDLVGNISTEHAVHGPNIVKYIERMTKATDQLIKLADMIQSLETKQSGDDPEDLYKMFDKKN